MPTMPTTTHKNVAPAPRNSTPVQRTPTPVHTKKRLPRLSQLAFAVFCLVTGMVFLLRDVPAFAGLHTAATLSYLLAAPLVTAGAWMLDRPHRARSGRLLLITFHTLFFPLQFAYSWTDVEPLFGAVFSIVSLVILRPRFPQLTPRTRKAWLFAHVGICAGWVGLSFGMTVLAITGAVTADPALRHAAYEIMHIFDLSAVIPTVILANISGLVLALGTPWGLIKHRWVLIKFVIALAIPLFAGIIQSGWIEELQENTKDAATDPGSTGTALAICMVGYGVLLWVAMFLSVYKPGGMTRWGRKAAEAARADRGKPTSGPQRTPAIPAIIEAVRTVATDVAVFDIVLSDGRPLPTWEPGAHIDVVLPSSKIRQYSLCGSTATALQIAVLHDRAGRGGSAEFHALGAGAAIGIRGPRNNFPLVKAPAYLFIAGGIGITPFLPMIWKLDREQANWQLYYRGRTYDSMAFADELRRRHPGRVVAESSATHPRRDLAALLRATPPGVAVYSCGPVPMLDAVAAAMPCACPHGTLYMERFAAVTRDAEPGRPFEAELRRSGETVRVSADGTLLAAIREIEPTLDFSCEDGVCGSCETRVLAGQPDHRDSVLQEHERERCDVIYPCVSRAQGSRIVLDV